MPTADRLLRKRLGKMSPEAKEEYLRALRFEHQVKEIRKRILFSYREQRAGEELSKRKSHEQYSDGNIS